MTEKLINQTGFESRSRHATSSNSDLTPPLNEGPFSNIRSIPKQSVCPTGKGGVKQTSLVAYREHQRSGLLGDQEAEVLAYISRNPFVTRREIEKGTGITISSICGRVNRLVHIGLIKAVGKRACSVTGKTSEVLVKW